MSNAWPLVALGEVLQKSDELVDLSPEQEYAQVTVRLWGKGVALRGNMMGSQIAASRQFIVRQNQFILSRIDARNGAFGLIPYELDGAIVSNDFPAYNLNKQRILPAYLDWLSKTSDFVETSRHASEGTTNRVRLQENIFLSTEIPLPPLEEQRRIVARIDALAARIAEARELRGAAMEESAALWVTSQRYLFLDKNKAWKTMTVEESCESIIDYRGRTPPISESGIPHLTSANIRNGRIDWNVNKFITEETYADFMTRGIPRPGDVIFTMEAPLGEAALILDDRCFSLAQRTIILRAASAVMFPEYLVRVITSPNVRADIFSKATATTVRGIASKNLKNILLPLPPLSEQRRIVEYLDGLQARVDALKARQAATAAELDALLPAILDRAFRGEL